MTSALHKALLAEMRARVPVTPQVGEELRRRHTNLVTSRDNLVDRLERLMQTADDDGDSDLRSVLERLLAQANEIVIPTIGEKPTEVDVLRVWTEEANLDSVVRRTELLFQVRERLAAATLAPVRAAYERLLKRIVASN